MHNYQSRRRGVQGLVCRKCGGRRFSVVYTRSRHDYVVRSRQCKDCRKRMITWERPAGMPPPQSSIPAPDKE